MSTFSQSAVNSATDLSSPQLDLKNLSSLTAESRPSGMFLGDLPVEIQYDISAHCSPSDLAVLSRVHTSVRDVAEHALYGHIRYCAQPLNMIEWPEPSFDLDYELEEVPQWLKESKSLLHTFAANSQKASMVKALYIDLEKNWVCDDTVRLALVKLAEALEKMPNLVDLRIIYSPMKDPFEGRISQVIRFVCNRWHRDNHGSTLITIWYHTVVVASNSIHYT
jgi:hypothetical protein